jgi:hypothetical protein
MDGRSMYAYQLRPPRIERQQQMQRLRGWTECWRGLDKQTTSITDTIRTTKPKLTSVNQMHNTIRHGDIRAHDLGSRRPTSNKRPARVTHKLERLPTSAGKVLRSEAGGVDGRSVDDVVC